MDFKPENPHGCFLCGDREHQPLISRSTPKGSLALCAACEKRYDEEGPAILDRSTPGGLKQ